ncbi:winged helix DNA-binding domain-containing protein [Fictibacillus fluitans]|uniref:Winged helix DNA-binding domain-containing protein n=1 Tax=Fictibacillus fluitans TaxID=3058422 RepID=A0ABT8I3W8_9BACL|nr:winged helix DNA-binding domain-containing protein [Fictibacillus sp. NE201]MDN4527714.1 winged helix DNA-binding domain-containing protein [Fictibacillus sp. NE201]
MNKIMNEIIVLIGGADISIHSVLNKKTLNRTLLARQLLLTRSSYTANEAIYHLAGLQAQAPHAPYIALWTRLQAFSHHELTTLLTNRKTVRMALHRGTLHLVSYKDALAWRVLMKPVFDKAVRLFSKKLEGADLEVLMKESRKLLEEKPCTLHELGLVFNERWPHVSPDIMANLVRSLVPLVQVPPRGIWGFSGKASHTTLEYWLGDREIRAAGMNELILRYFQAFGPASIKDIQVWSGLTGLKKEVELMRPQLRSFRDENGTELLDVQDGPIPEENTPAPVRFLSEFDNMLLSFQDRSRIMEDRFKKRIFTKNGIIRPTVLVDGFVKGIWKIEEQKKITVLVIELFDKISVKEQRALFEEGHKLLNFIHPEKDGKSITINKEEFAKQQTSSDFQE